MIKIKRRTAWASDWVKGYKYIFCSSTMSVFDDQVSLCYIAFAIFFHLEIKRIRRMTNYFSALSVLFLFSLN